MVTASDATTEIGGHSHVSARTMTATSDAFEFVRGTLCISSNVTYVNSSGAFVGVGVVAWGWSVGDRGELHLYQEIRQPTGTFVRRNVQTYTPRA